MNEEVNVSMSLFADDTTFVGVKDEGEMNEGVKVVKNVISRWEKANNEKKEEELVFGTDEGDSIRMLGSWVGTNDDANNRIKRKNGVWWRVRV